MYKFSNVCYIKLGNIERSVLKSCVCMIILDCHEIGTF